MASSRKPGSDRGRPAIDWQAAFAFYVSLPAPVRSYQAVADEFVVSRRTVEEHGAREGWKERLRAIEAEAAATVAEQLSQAQAEQRAEIMQIAKAMLLRFAHQLRTGEGRITGAEFERVSRFLLELIENTETISTAPAAGKLASPVASGGGRSAEEKAQVVHALHESGALSDLLTALTPAAPIDEHHDDNNDEGEAQR